MKKSLKILGASLATVFLLQTTACVNNETYVAPAEFFELDAFTENSDSGAYDSSLFYRNNLDIFGADASCIYVPEGRHEDENGEDKYGGYYYMYPSPTNIGMQGLVLQTNVDENGVKYKATNPVYRSKDLNSWELCGGVDGTFSTRVEMDDWAESGIMAPDPIYDEKTGKYFIYEQTNSKLNDSTGLYSEFPTEQDIKNDISAIGEDPNDSAVYNKYRWWNTFYIGIYISDTPTGPFVPVTSELYYGDANQPNLNGKVITRFNTPVNIRYDIKQMYDADMDEIWGTLDAHPYIDDDGQMYLYFCHHVSTDWDRVDIWGMKMKDMITPDYTTMTWLIRANSTTVTKNENWEQAPWAMESYDYADDYVLENGAHGTGNEGAFVLSKEYTKDNGEKAKRHFLIYSGGGYNNKYYDMSQTYSDNGPLGPFIKPEQYASSIVGTSLHNDWCMGNGHGCLVPSPSGDEMFILGWSHTDETYNAPGNGRHYVVDKVHWVETDKYGLLLYGNGPTKSLQPKMYDYTGYKNIAEDAMITVSSKEDFSGVKYLTDELFVSHDFYGDWEFKTKGKTHITLTFDEPRTIRSVLVYNSYLYEYAFSGLDYIEFDIAEKPAWYQGETFVSTARISNVPFSNDFIGTTYQQTVRSGAASLASFNEIKVKSITIAVSKKLKDTNNEIRISDIVVLGK